MSNITVSGWPAFRGLFQAELARQKMNPFQLATKTGIAYSTILTAMKPDASNIKLETVTRIMTALSLSWEDVARELGSCKPKPKPKPKRV